MAWKGIATAATVVCMTTSLVGCAHRGDDAPSMGSAGAFFSSPSPTPEFVREGVSTDWVEVDGQRIQVPEGIILPSDIHVTGATEATVMIAEANPQTILDAISASAEEAGYTMVAKRGEGRRLWIGYGNAVLLDAAEGAHSCRGHRNR